MTDLLEAAFRMAARALRPDQQNELAGRIMVDVIALEAETDGPVQTRAVPWRVPYLRRMA